MSKKRKASFLIIPLQKYQKVEEKMLVDDDDKDDDTTEFSHNGDYFPIQSLPYVALVHILELLPVSDRKNARLTCKWWYDCCSRMSITENEKFVFKNDVHGLETMATTLVTSKSLQMNLEFHGLSIKGFPEFVWEACGQRVRSLELSGCRWNDEAIKNILLHCVNLRSFYIYEEDIGRHDEDDVVFCSPAALTKLVEKGVKRTILNRFTIIFNDKYMPGSELEKLLLVCPNIKYFNTGDSDNGISKQEKVTLAIDDILHSFTRLESLVFNPPTDGNWMKTSAVNLWKPDPKLCRLKHFETTLNYTKYLKKILFDFFSCQKNLKVVRLRVLKDNSHELLRNVTLHALENCSNLLEFRFTFDATLHADERLACVHLKWDELPRFIGLISKLELLKLSFNVSESDPPSQEILKSLPSRNFSLTTLRLDHYDLNKEFFAIFFERCTLLQYLQLCDEISDCKLQIIFHYLLNLQTLILKTPSGKMPMCTDFGFCGGPEGYSIKRLRRLTHLDVCSTLSKVSERFIRELQLPRLKFLKLDLNGLYHKLPVNVLTCFASQVPALRVLSIDIRAYGGGMSMKKFCHLFKYLHCVIITRYEFRFDVKLKERLKGFFEACPSLRYFKIQGNSTKKTFYFNPLTRKFQKVSSQDLEYLESYS